MSLKRQDTKFELNKAEVLKLGLIALQGPPGL